MRGIVLLGAGLGVAALLAAAAALDGWSRRAHRVAGGFQLHDRAGGAPFAARAAATAAGFLLVGLAWALTLRSPEPRTMLEEGYWLGLACLVLLLGAATAGAVAAGRALYRRARGLAAMAPGELVTAAWPLVGGERTAVSYRRVVRHDADLEQLEAHLVCRRMRQGKDGAHQVLVGALPLGDGGAALTDGVLTAAWSLEVPRSHRALAERLEAVGRSMDWWTGAAWHYTWTFEVTVAFDGGLTDEAAFPLNVDAPAWSSLPEPRPEPD